jgi:hypothetical protein
LTTSAAATGEALTSNVDPSLSDTAVGGSAAEDVNPPGRDAVVDELAANRGPAEEAVSDPHAASTVGTATRKAATAARAIAFLWWTR